MGANWLRHDNGDEHGCGNDEGDTVAVRNSLMGKVGFRSGAGKAARTVRGSGRPNQGERERGSPCKENAAEQNMCTTLIGRRKDATDSGTAKRKDEERGEVEAGSGRSAGRNGRGSRWWRQHARQSTGL
ncbi:hypothetical protein ERJ75_000525800 [Trypanosoma vivax]|nr:hypothetical protein ERJ75_000525800 [Trypanosoma vivax]